jgi:hypothetical protein
MLELAIGPGLKYDYVDYVDVYFHAINNGEREEELFRCSLPSPTRLAEAETYRLTTPTRQDAGSAVSLLAAAHPDATAAIEAAAQTLGRWVLDRLEVGVDRGFRNS